MKPPSEPQINKSNPKKWFIYFSVDVPPVLWQKYARRRVRFKKYDNINTYTGAEKEDYAEQRRQIWKYALFTLKYSPFDEELKEFTQTSQTSLQLKREIHQVKNKTEEEKRVNQSISTAFSHFNASRKARKLQSSTLAAYKGTTDWLFEALQNNKHHQLPISKITFVHISQALDYMASLRSWNATTINKEMGFVVAVFNWLTAQDYVLKNPVTGKFEKLPMQKKVHTWYDRELAKKVKNAVLDAGKDKVYRAMQFTYYLLIRSKIELQKLKIGDIDRDLKRIRFSADLSKNNSEAYRDYPAEFEKVLDEMELEKFPNDYFVFGKGDGTPGPYPVGHNFFSKQFKAIKDKINLPADYTIYGWKHTRIVHELMKGTDGAEISHMARHSDFKTTKEYLRDYDITLKNIYKPEDLTF